jgi:3-oxoacyl-[acyl-carrier protein] reductase
MNRLELCIKGKVGVVTGSGSEKGIGHAIALALAREGVHVVITDITLDGVQSLLEKIKSIGRKAISLKVDQGSHKEVKDAVVQVMKVFGSIDILINCAALTSNFGTIAKMDTSEWEHEINVNLNGPYYWTREILPTMKKNNWGRIVNISSVAGTFGMMGVPSYAVSKGGLHTFTKQAAIENASSGITVNALVLGLISTAIYDKPQFSDEAVNRLVSGIPMGRMGRAEEVGEIAAFLCSEKAGYITGALIPVDGAISTGI